MSLVNLEMDCSNAGDQGNLDNCVIDYSVVRALYGYFGPPCEQGALLLACDAEDLEHHPYTPEINVFDLDEGINVGEQMEVVTSQSEYPLLSNLC